MENVELYPGHKAEVENRIKVVKPSKSKTTVTPTTTTSEAAPVAMELGQPVAREREGESKEGGEEEGIVGLDADVDGNMVGDVHAGLRDEHPDGQKEVVMHDATAYP